MLETERLDFRPYTEDDLDFLLSMSSDQQVMKYIGNGSVWTEEETEERLHRFIAHLHQHGYALMIAMHKQEARPIGHAGLIQQLVEGVPETEIGYWISRAYWGQGLATEAAIGWRHYAQTELNKQRLISLIHPLNTSSVAVARKNGMELEREVIFRSRQVLLYSTSPSV